MKMMESNGYYAQGICTAMAANKISYCFDFRGPSYVCDTACSSSLYALVHAFNDLKNEVVDYAIAGGTHLCFSAHQTSEYAKLQLISTDGVPKPFSTERNGFVRSEAVVAFFLQRNKNCRRAYATIAAGKTNSDGYKKEGISFPSYKAHLNFLENIYENFNLSPDDVVYFDAHAPGMNRC